MRRTLTLVGIIAFTTLLQHLLGGSITQLVRFVPCLGVFGFTMLFSIRHVGLEATWRALFLSKALNSGSPVEFDSYNSEIRSHALFAANLSALLGIIHSLSILHRPYDISEGLVMAFMSYFYGMLLAGLLPLGNLHCRPTRVSPGELLLPPALLGLTVLSIFYVLTVTN